MQGIQRLEKLRHDLRTFLNHIIGYSDIIRTDLHEYSRHKYIPAINQITKKAEKIKRLINFYFDTQTDFQDLATLEDIKKAFYVPLVQIISDSRRLLVTFRRDDPRFASDTEQLLSVANNMLEIIEAEVADIQIEDISSKEIESRDNTKEISLPQYTDEDYLEEFEGDKAKNPGKILVIDDDEASRELLGRFLTAIGHEIILFERGKLALEYLENNSCDMVMLDVMMPEMTGFQVLRRLKQNQKTRSIPVFMISAMEDSESIAQFIKAGAEDYLNKDYEAPVLKARIDACFNRGYLLKQQGVYIEALLKSQQALARELSDAGNYITSLLPKPLHGRINTGISFIPSAQLGGDFPGYHWLDETHLAIYLVDVSGHGIRSALLAVSIANLLRSQGIPHTNFFDPKSVLSELGRQNIGGDELFYTIWYGVINTVNFELTYSSAGSPPALLYKLGSVAPDLRMVNNEPMIGFDENFKYSVQKTQIEPNSRLILFSDGLFETIKPNGKTLGLEDFIKIINMRGDKAQENVNEVLHQVQAITMKESFEDDISIMEIQFQE